MEVEEHKETTKMENIDYAKLFAEIASNEKVMESLPKEIRDSIESVKAAADKRKKEEDAERISRQKQIKKEHDTKVRKEQRERNKLLCIGEWGEKVPFNRRFAICQKNGKRFKGFSGEEKDPSKWESIKEYCAIDLVRGYTAPYWGYYQYWKNNGLDAFYNEEVKKVLDAKNAGDIDKVVSLIRCNWDFFKIEGDEINDKFRIVNYKIGENGDVEVLGFSELKSLIEHQEDLRKEFANER